MVVIEQLGETKRKIIQEIGKDGGEGLPGKKIASRVGKHKSTISGHCQDLQPKYITSRKSGNTKLFQLTDTGKDKALELSPTPSQSNNCDSEVTKGQEEDVENGPRELDLHNFSGRCSIENLAMFNDDWKQRAVDYTDEEWEYEESNDTYFTYIKDFRIRITSENVIIRLEKGIEEYDSEVALNQGFDKLEEARKWVEDNTPLKLSNNIRVTIKETTGHLAIKQDPLARFVKNQTPWKLSDYEVIDEEGVQRLWLDDSHGENHHEAGHSPGENKNYETDIGKIQDMYRGIISDKFDSSDMSWMSDFRESSPDRRMELLEMGLQAMIVKSLGQDQGQEDSGCCCSCGHQEDEPEENDRLKELERKMNERMDRL